MGWLQSCCAGKVWLQTALVIVRLSVHSVFNIMRAVPLFLKQNNLLWQCVMCWSSFIWLRPVLHLLLPCSGRPERQPSVGYSLGLLAVRGLWLGLTDKGHQQRKDEEEGERDCFLLLALVDGCVSQPMSGSHVRLQGSISCSCCLWGLENNSVVMLCCVASKRTFNHPLLISLSPTLSLLWIPFLKSSQLPRFHLAWFLLGKYAQMFRRMTKALRYLDHYLQLSP